MNLKSGTITKLIELLNRAAFFMYISANISRICRVYIYRNVNKYKFIDITGGVSIEFC